MAVKPAIVKQKGDGTDVSLGADDLLPIFIYVLSQAELQNPIVNIDLLWTICHPDQLHGEAGYYLTLYESAVEYVLQEGYTLEEADEAVILKESMEQWSKQQQLETPRSRGHSHVSRANSTSVTYA